jgi:diaminohydroxyphosphoribosylaminopyrimidine deaminase / 5-amino-6-(5-phosphoribosylamino)uracil reductase
LEHYPFLMKALELARKRRGFCAPNPSVGAIIVSGNEVIATGYHYAAGHPHAEVVACQQLPPNARDLVLYVTLEPCCHWGRTPPCTELILQSGIKKVFYGYQDPNPKVAGKGEELLRQNGIECRRIAVQEIEHFYKSYKHWTLTGKPWVTCKLAISLDAKIASESAQPIAITGVEAQHYTHMGRLQSDAILTSARTILQDDPALNVRLNDLTIPKHIYCVDTNLTLPLNAKIFGTASAITVFHSEKNIKQMQVLKERGVVCHLIREKEGRLDLEEILVKIGKDGIHDLWVEAGGNLFGAFIKEKLAQKSLIYVAPKLLGNNAYSAFSDTSNIMGTAKKINWHCQGCDAICEIEWV